MNNNLDIKIFYIISQLVRAHSTNEGVSKEIHYATFDLIETFYGKVPAMGYNCLINVNDERFYITDEEDENSKAKQFLDGLSDLKIDWLTVQ